MEKINTPLMALLEELDKHIKPSCSDHTPFRGICQNCHNHNVFNVLDLTPEQLVEKVQSILPTEREVIEKFYEKGKHYRSHISFNDQFTQTFKSYEE